MSPLPIDIPRPTRALALALTAALLASLIPLAGAAATADHLVVSAAVAGNYISGAPLTVTVTAANPDGSTDTAYTGTIHFTSSDPAGPTLPANYTFVDGDNGTHQFTGVVLNTAGSQTITATDTVTSSITGSTSVAVKLQLVFTQQPGGSTGGVALSPQPVVQLQTAAASPDGNSIGGNVTVTLITGTNTGGGSLTGCAVAAVNGTATFTTCQIDKVGTYTLVASAPNGVSAVSSSFAITPGPAYGLQFVSYPSSPSSTALTTISVRIVDAGGNAASGAPTATIVLTLSTNPGATTLSCSTGVATVNGTATFNGCTLSGGTPIANGYVITATATSASPALVQTSVTGPSAFNVTSGPATHLVFCWGSVCSTMVPTTSTGGTAFPVQPVIVLQDSGNRTVTADSSTLVYLSISAAGTGATLACNGATAPSLRVTAGVAAFSGCSIDKVGTYQLTATSSPYYTPATSGSFVVSAGPPTKLTFTAQPTSGAAGQAFPIQPVVAITDAGGNPATSSSATVTLSLNNPYGSSGALTCTGGLSKATYLGVATFSGCAISAAGTGYSITATASNVYPYVFLSPVTTNAFNVSLPPAQITLTPSASVIVWAKPVVLTAQFGTNGANKPFALQASLDKVHWYTIASLTTNASGAASFSYTPATNLWYQAVFAGTPDLGAATTTPFRVVVRQIALLRPTNSGKTKTIASGTDVTFTTTVRPARPELPKAKVTFTFTLYRDGHIVYSGKRDVYIDSAGLAKWTWKFGSSGLWYVRSIANPTTANANSVWSQIEKYYVP